MNCTLYSIDAVLYVKVVCEIYIRLLACLGPRGQNVSCYRQGHGSKFGLDAVCSDAGTVSCVFVFC